ncbi:MAG: helix-turn-helix domain-containing protein [Oscillospiraceae bacterium]|nr:helix-turn-helix domain-containing protein [Oscillospiraceae bacterium]
MEIGREIRRLRTGRGLTQEALAAALNVSPQSVSKWECGSSMPDVQMLPEIAVYFGVTIDQLFAMTPEQQMERIENRIYSSGKLSEAEERQIEQQMYAFAEDLKYEGQAKTLLTKLYNHQAEQYRLLATACGKEAVEKSGGDRDAVSELANAWGSYIPDWNVRNHHALIEWFSDYCRSNPKNRAALMWLMDNLIDDRRLSEAREWLEKLAVIDNTFRTVMYRYLIALAEGDSGEAEKRLGELEKMEDREWSRALTLGDIYTQRQEYDKAVEWYRRGQEMQPSPKYVDSAVSIAHICEIRGDKTGAIKAYREALRLLKEDWGLISGDECEEVERAIKKLQG